MGNEWGGGVMQRWNAGEKGKAEGEQDFTPVPDAQSPSPRSILRLWEKEGMLQTIVTLLSNTAQTQSQRKPTTSHFQGL